MRPDARIRSGAVADLVALLTRGGIVVTTPDAEATGRAIVAQTLIQLDGDIQTTVSAAALADRAAFAGHYDRVERRVRRVARRVRLLRRMPAGAVLVAVAVALFHDLHVFLDPSIRPAPSAWDIARQMLSGAGWSPATVLILGTTAGVLRIPAVRRAVGRMLLAAAGHWFGDAFGPVPASRRLGPR